MQVTSICLAALSSDLALYVSTAVLGPMLSCVGLHRVYIAWLQYMRKRRIIQPLPGKKADQL